jgi:NAD(P)-dependent dehydrogenase (short-subunit alcohol dehydrogenase family)
MGRLDNRTAFITGAAMGNGRGIAESFLKEGANVILADKSEEVYSSARELGDGAFAYRVDITDNSGIEGCVRNVLGRFGRIDILVNNAGIARFSLFQDMTEELFDLHYRINVKGAFHCTKAILPSMLEHNYGRIINMSSVTGPFVADPGEVAYAVSKAALIGFTKALAVEVAGKNITVNALCPGYILTPMVKHSARESNPENPQSVIDRIAAGIPMKRLGTPKNIGDLAVFFASDEADYITGQTMVIDGGSMLPETNAMGLQNMPA